MISLWSTCEGNVPNLQFPHNGVLHMVYRKGVSYDLEQIQILALSSWSQLQNDLSPENWQRLFKSLSNRETYVELLEKSCSFVCENTDKELIGMAFLVSSGNPTDIFLSEWCYIRYVSVAPEFAGRGIGRRLVEKCIELAKETREQTIALHTSEIMHQARHIYESLGFTVLREIEPRNGKKYWLYTLDIA
ncbi:ribosomal protein S18 acetylase RimI-like enzyme [Rhabdobacter roseus]|uniref:Ribosomal protein S18 acetylase RimI-like enzyme n=1 Tax=Rhabdobacter roseus TaxID=1655419 RepID=A0A840U418_9BACT|nr:GNAT family N-acetyltransferase [Rhabdobacter roseus]MBB5287078.1 ribosomal protein S18 acetylase RimI-like enzyme [Rhabdobacter roseus]